MGRSLQILAAAQGAAELEAVHLGQHHVEDGGVKTALGQQLQPRAGAQRLHQFQLEALEVSGQRRAKLFVVVNQRDAVHGAITAQHSARVAQDHLAHFYDYFYIGLRIAANTKYFYILSLIFEQ